MSIDKAHSIKQRALRAGAWTLGGHAISQAIRLASNLIMTRLLVPEMFGEMAIASMVLAGIGFLSDLGTRQSIIQSHRGDDPDFLNTIWSVQVIRGILIFVVGTILSIIFYFTVKAGIFPSESAYTQPTLPLVLVFISFTEVIAGFQSTNLATAGRKMLLGRVTYIEILSQVSGIILMVILAYFSKSIWALVAGGIVTSLVKTISSHKLLSGIKNEWKWDKTALKEIMHFGKWVLLSSAFGFLGINGDRLILGGLINAHTLGIYVIAYFIVNTITQAVGRVLGNVAFPVLSEIARNNPQKLYGTYYKFRYPVDIGLLFLSGFMFEAGRYAIYFLYDDRYIQAGEMLQILSLTMIAYRYIVIDQCYLALGKPNLLAMLLFIRVSVMFVSVPIAFSHFQITGALWALVASAFSSVPLTMYLKYKMNLINIRSEIIVLPVFFIGIGAGYIFEQIISKFIN